MIIPYTALVLQVDTTCKSGVKNSVYHHLSMDHGVNLDGMMAIHKRFDDGNN